MAFQQADEVLVTEERTRARVRSYSDPIDYKAGPEIDEAEDVSTNGTDMSEAGSFPEADASVVASQVSDSSFLEADGDASKEAGSEYFPHGVGNVEPSTPHGAFMQQCGSVMGYPMYAPAFGFNMVPMPTDSGNGSFVWTYPYQPQIMQAAPPGNELEEKANELEKLAAQYAAAAQEATAAANRCREKEDAREVLRPPEPIVESKKKGARNSKESKQVSEAQRQKRVATSSQVRQDVGTQDDRTTLMLRNLPNDYSRDMLLNLFDEVGFAGCYDFLYLPIDFHRGAGFGYAFVNLVSHADAERAVNYFHGYTNWAVGSAKVCEVCWGEPLQGLEAHCDRYRNSPVMHELVPDEFKPAIFQRGVRVPFPQPTKRIRPPRTKTQPPTSRAAR